MKTLIVFISVLFTIIILAACSDENSSSPSLSDTYLYKSYDSTGSLIAEGEFTIHQHEFGSGNLVGGIDDDKMWINLNPNYADNNCYLYGNRHRNIYSGEWQWATFAGITNKGPFIALFISSTPSS
jgi:hypothetical protein